MTANHYRADRAHAEFLLFDVLGRDGVYGTDPYPDVDVATARDLLAHAERFATERLAPSFAEAERDPVVLDPGSGRVRLPAGLRGAIRDHLASDVLHLELPPELGGVAVPPSLRWAAAEHALGANPAVAMCSQIVPLFATLLHRAGTPAQQRLARLVLERGWAVTMALTEADAGSDVGAARTRAHRQDDGTWHLEGTKRFITWGDHDASENIVHFVLARPVGVEGAGGPGSRGLSLFVVTSHLFDADSGVVTGPNGVVTTALEHKMGLRGTPTCELVLGAEQPCEATLLGDRYDGLRQMFTVLVYMRMMIGLKATAALSSGRLHAADFARTRVQGASLTGFPSPTGGPTGPAGPPVEIVDHPDVRRSLLTQRAYADGSRALVLYAATLLDTVEAARLSGVRSTEADEAAERNQLLLPVVKGWCSESAWRVLGSECLQTLGGSGYLADYPVEQYVRDTKVDTIYEGTTAIQGLDLLGRRVLKDGGTVLDGLLDDIEATAKDLGAAPAGLAAEAGLLAEGVSAVRATAATLGARAAAGEARRAALSATPLLLAVGDVTVGWLLLRSAAVAAAKLAATGADAVPPGPARDTLSARTAAARWFARQVLPHLAATAVGVRLTDDAALAVPGAAL